jgi:uncharacterized protein YndB with AHSA1/START domain
MNAQALRRPIDGWRGPNGYTLVCCEVDLRAGNSARACIRSPRGREHWVDDVCLELFEPERLVLRGTLEVEGQRLSRSADRVTFRREEVG